MRIGLAAAISFLVAACGTADHEISEVDGVRAAYGEAQKKRQLTPAEMLRRAESSFSPVAFGVSYEQAAKLGGSTIDLDFCRRIKGCLWTDTQNVQYEADAEGGVFSKAVEVRKLPSQSLNLLGIGRARSRDDVLRAIGSFLPTTKFECVRPPPDAEGAWWCDALVGDGFIELQFNDNSDLAWAIVEARPES